MTENIKTQQLSEAISERYLSYAMSTIVARSLPDVRDGLKPVHRRLLYTMRQLHLDPSKGFKKCARVVGDVMGKYHPHGDASIYDAMVRLAQSFSVRYPLVIGQGNFGNIDGDSAAAMRYTEAKMSAAAVAIMDGLDEDAVDFRDTYSGEDVEPVVMPSAFPNLLANGSNGIAVGMATNIPPHNILELLDGILALLKKPTMEVAELCEFITAPDFPTGGIIAQDRASIIEAYSTGRGNFTMLAKWEREDLPYSNYQIAITEIPYQVQKSRLIEKIAEAMETGKLPLVGDVRDESAEDVRIVIEPKSRAVEASDVMAQLYANTELMSRFALNMNVLDAHGVPRVMNLKQVLEAFVEHRVEVITRRAQFRLGNIRRRLEILAGLLIAYLNLDEVIKIIRENDEPKPLLMSRFKLSDAQAEAILNMKLRQLRKLEEIEIKAESDALKKEEAELADLVSSDKNKLKRVAEEAREMRAGFAKDKALAVRRTSIDEAAVPVAAPVSLAAIREPLTIIVSKMGWVKALKTHVDLTQEFSFKEGDALFKAFHAYTTDKVVFAASSGQFFSLDASRISSGRGYGDVIRLLFEISAEAEIIDAFVPGESRAILVSRQGYGFVVDGASLVASTKNGKIVMSPADGDSLALVLTIPEGDDMFAIAGTNRRLLAFPIAEIPVMARGKGVILQKYKEAGVELADARTFARGRGISFINGARTYTVEDISMWAGKRADVGHMPPNGFSKSNKFF
ncbi:MAG: DNA topoisomerase IV subunit A [Rickettsiales bacterium]|jgi:topoisomerase-4 subunit A|nr:DNA topoisomerase IV subunit A [Rickettsiales bacterium]